MSPATGAGARESDRDFPSFPRAALHVFGLFGFWVAQPLYDLISRNPAFLIAHGTDAEMLLLFALCVSAVGPLLLIAPIALVWPVHRGAGRAAYGVVVGALFAAMALVLTRNATALAAPAALLLGLAAGTVGALAVLRAERWSRILSGLSVAALAFPAVFLFRSPLWTAEPEATPEALVEIESATPVVLVVLDEFPLASLLDADGGIDRTRTPHLAAFADGALWFREATAVASDTNIAVPAILTGRYPQGSVAPILARHPQNLFTLLRGNGRIEAFEEITKLCPKDVCHERRSRGSRSARLRVLLLDAAVVAAQRILPVSLSASLPPIDGSWSGFVTGARVRPAPVGVPGVAGYRGRWRPFGELLEAIGEAPDARLFFLHLLAPHAPWNTLPSGREFGPVELFPHGFAADRVGPDPWEALQGLQRYLLQVGFVDRMLRDLFDALRDAGLYDRALLIVTSDHGASFEPGQHRRYLDATNFADLLAVPLLVKLPGQQGGELVDRPVETIDILPTIAEVLGVRVPWEIDGRSLLDAAAPERRVKQAFHGRRLAYDPAEIAQGRARSASRIRSLFGSGTAGLFEIGPHPELVRLLGLEVSALGVDPQPEDGVVSLDGPQRFERVDPSAASLPVHITGTLSPRAAGERPQVLAVALNGRVAAVTQSYGGERSAFRFSALVPEDVFSAGRNEVAIYRVLPASAGAAAAAGVRLRELRRSDERYVLERRGGTEFIRTATRDLPVVVGAVTGTAILAGGGLTGVAAGRVERAPVDQIVLFLGGEELLRFRPGGLPDLIDEVEGASFRVSLLGEQVERIAAGRAQLRIFGLLDDRAGEIEIQGAARRR